MDINITELKEFSDYEEDQISERYEKVLHINKLDSDKDKATAQIITAFNRIHDIVSKNPTDTNKNIFDTYMKPAYEELISRYVRPVTFANKVLTDALLKDLDKLEKKHPAIIFSNIKSIHNDYTQYMKILNPIYCKETQRCKELKTMITEKYNAALKYFMLEPTTANNLNRALLDARKHIPSSIDEQLILDEQEQLIPEEQEELIGEEQKQLLAELETAYPAYPAYPAYITAPANLINFIIV